MSAKSYFEEDLFTIYEAFDGGEDSMNELYNLVDHRLSKSRIAYELILGFGLLNVVGVLLR